jgi:hypothetical protein
LLLLEPFFLVFFKSKGFPQQQGDAQEKGELSQEQKVEEEQLLARLLLAPALEGRSNFLFLGRTFCTIL